MRVGVSMLQCEKCKMWFEFNHLCPSLELCEECSAKIPEDSPFRSCEMPRKKDERPAVHDVSLNAFADPVIASRSIRFVGFREENGKLLCLISVMQRWTEEHLKKLREKDPGVPAGEQWKMLIPYDDLIGFVQGIRGELIDITIRHLKIQGADER